MCIPLNDNFNILALVLYRYEEVSIARHTEEFIKIVSNFSFKSGIEFRTINTRITMLSSKNVGNTIVRCLNWIYSFGTAQDKVLNQVLTYYAAGKRRAHARELKLASQSQQKVPGMILPVSVLKWCIRKIYILLVIREHNFCLWIISLTDYFVISTSPNLNFQL